MKTVTFSAPGKIILSGEHAVVYDHPALVAAVDKRILLKLSFKDSQYFFEIKSSIPSRSGMGSSAALAAVEQAALLYIAGHKKLDKTRINALAFEMERKAHGNPSGVDNTISVYGGLLRYQKSKGFKKLKLDKLPQFLLINTGKPAENTADLVVGIVGKRVKNKDEQVLRALEDIGLLPDRIVTSLAVGDYKSLKEFLIQNERLLEKIGVVGEKAKKIIRDIEGLGGAAKISGAGGVKKGSGIALVYHQNLKIIKDYCRKENLKFYEANLGEEGLKIDC